MSGCRWRTRRCLAFRRGTAELRCQSPNAQVLYRPASNDPEPRQTVSAADEAQRWMDLAMYNGQPLNPALSGLPVEYRIIQLYSRDAGAREVHMRISCPPTISPCFYGVDTPRRSELIAALRSLPGDERAVVFLVDIHGFDYTRAAEALGVPVGTVASRLNRARISLRRALRPRGGGSAEAPENPKDPQ